MMMVFMMTMATMMLMMTMKTMALMIKMTMMPMMTMMTMIMPHAHHRSTCSFRRERYASLLLTALDIVSKVPKK